MNQCICVFLQGKGHGKVKLRMKYMSLEAIYSQPRTATVVRHSVLLDWPFAEPWSTLYMSNMALCSHCHHKLSYNRPKCCLCSLYTSGKLA